MGTKDREVKRNARWKKYTGSRHGKGRRGGDGLGRSEQKTKAVHSGHSSVYNVNMLNKLIVLFSNVDTFNIDKLHLNYIRKM